MISVKRTKSKDGYVVHTGVMGESFGVRVYLGDEKVAEISDEATNLSRQALARRALKWARARRINPMLSSIVGVTCCVDD